jgi:hypothetical protein
MTITDPFTIGQHGSFRLVLLTIAAALLWL